LNKYNRSTLFLLPLLYNQKYFTVSKITSPNYGFYLDNLYLAETSKEEFESYEDNDYFIHAVFNVKDPNSDHLRMFLIHIKSHPLYFTDYSIDLSVLNVVFKVDKKTSELVIKKFKAGKYSEMPEIYRTNFEGLANKSLNSVFNILTKNPFLRSDIEKRLNVILPENAELDSIPYKEQETFDYVKKKQNKKKQEC
jgi:hypothetical protein